MDPLSAYIPIDRRLALARGEELPKRTTGAALFADISGFTPLTEALALELGPRRGAEELTVHLNNVYNALIAELHRYGGSVIGFSGDAITCWLDGDDGRRAVAAGLAMQQAMQQFAQVKTHLGRVFSLAMKVAIASGPVRRFVAGDPEHLLWDVLAGQTVARMAAGEGLAERGEVLVDEATAVTLGAALQISEWRTAEEGRSDRGDRGYPFAVVTGLDLEVAERPWPDLPEGALEEEFQAQWLLPPVYRRLQSGLGEFLAELRPAVALFMRFSGIDYDQDPDAPQKLDAFVRDVERILGRYDGSLVQLTVGDKGSYLYAGFGAPIAHEDDAARAASTALALQELVAGLPYLEEAQIGVTVGRMRTGAYGSATRRTYGILGDAVNLSARLMSNAAPGQILVSDEARAVTGDLFSWERLPALKVKGKREPVPVSRLLGLQRRTGSRLAEPAYLLPMVGRRQELAFIEERLALALASQGQVVSLVAEAGMGKSRLAAEVVDLARTRGLAVLAGECQSYGTNTSYLVWQPVWSRFFDLDPRLSPEAQVAHLEAELRRLDPSLVPRLPLLAAVLNVAIPDNLLTASLDARVRKEALEDLLVRCLRVQARLQPLLLVLEDMHWIDPVSRDLVEAVGRAVADLPVLVLLVQRPPDARQLQAPQLSQLPYFHQVRLTEFTQEEAAQLIQLKLDQFFEGRKLDPALLERLATQAAGNPFFIEEVLNYLHDLGVDPGDPQAVAAVELPSSIHSLVLSRIDQLSQEEQITIKVASVIGRMFRAAMVWGVHPQASERVQVRVQLDHLSELHLTPLDVPDPELTYLFKHVVTQQVAYESLLFATRAMLHEQIGQYIERAYADALEQYVDLLAFHYDHSENQAKRREYLRKAGESAQRSYANAAAIDYYQRLAPLLDGEEKGLVLLLLGEVLDDIGEYGQAEVHDQEALAIAQDGGYQTLTVQCQVAIGEVLRKQGRLDEAEPWFARALEIAERMDYQPGVAKALSCMGTVAVLRGDYDGAQTDYERGLAIRRELRDQHHAAILLNNLAVIAANRGDFSRAGALFSQSLDLRRELGDKWEIANSLNNLGQLNLLERQYPQAQQYLEEGLAILREIGVKRSIGLALLNLANVQRGQGQYAGAGQSYRESLQLARELGDQWLLAYLLDDIGGLLSLQGQSDLALRLAGAGSALHEATGAPLSPPEAERLDAALAPARDALGEEAASAAWEAGRGLSLDEAVELALSLDGGQA